MGEELTAALDKLDLVEVGDAAGLVFEGLSRSRTGACKDPFRSDDTHPSFHVISKDGRAVGYKDYTGNLNPSTGNLWQFAKLCWPGDSAAELSARLIDMAGTRKVDTGSAKKTREELAKERKALARAQRRAVEKSASKQLEMPDAAALPQRADVSVVKRWDAGQREENLTDDDLDRLCDERGWPVEWGEGCRRYLSRPPLPWRDEGDAKEERHWAFPVEAPGNTHEGCADSGKLVFMGYHQRYYRDGRKCWVFVPYMPADAGKWMSVFQKAYVEAARAAGAEWGERLVNPVPFAIGERSEPRLVVIVEGQWDAISVYGALGGFFDGDPLPVLALGIRGVGNADLLLAYWGRRLRWLGKQGILKGIWVIGDADRAGAALTQTRMVSGKVPEYAFSERLQKILGVHVVATWLRGDRKGLGKDFNDYWKAKRPSAESLWKWLKAQGLGV